MLLGAPDLGLAVAWITIATEAVLGVAHAVSGHLGEVRVGEPRLEDDRARVHLHPVGMEVGEALRRRDRERLRGDGIVRPARRGNALARRHDAGDPPVDVGIEEVDRRLARGEVTPYA